MFSPYENVRPQAPAVSRVLTTASRAERDHHAAGAAAPPDPHHHRRRRSARANRPRLRRAWRAQRRADRRSRPALPHSRVARGVSRRRRDGRPDGDAQRQRALVGDARRAGGRAGREGGADTAGGAGRSATIQAINPSCARVSTTVFILNRSLCVCSGAAAARDGAETTGVRGDEGGRGEGEKKPRDAATLSAHQGADDPRQGFVCWQKTTLRSVCNYNLLSPP